MGVALVNLVWRRLAVVPAVLLLSWQVLKPHYQNGDIPAAAWLLREGLNLPEVSPFSNAEREELKQELKDATVIDELLRTYERGNAQNLIALCYLDMCLNSADPSQVHRGLSDNQSVHKRLNERQNAEQQADALFGDIPSLPVLANLPDDIQSLIARGAQSWVPANYQGLTPSVFRHIAYWPGVLNLFASRLESIEQRPDTGIAGVSAQALTSARAQASVLGNSGNCLTDLNTTDRLWLQQVLEVFIDGMLARGVVIVPTLRTLLR